MKMKRQLPREKVKVLKTLAVALTLFAFFMLRLPAQTSVNIEDALGLPGATVSLLVSIANATNLAAAQFDVAFDRSRVSSLDSVSAAQLPNVVVRSRQIAPGIQRVLVYSLDKTALARVGEAPVINLPFVLSPTEYVGSGLLMPTNVILANASAAQIAPVVINPGAIFISPVNLLPNGQARVIFPSASGQNYVVQATTNFVQWLNISTNIAPGNFLNYIDADAPLYPLRFYRTQSTN